MAITYTKIGNFPQGQYPSGNYFDENSGFCIGRRNPSVLFAHEDGPRSPDAASNYWIYAFSLNDLSLIKTMRMVGNGFTMGNLAQLEDMAYSEPDQKIWVANCGYNGSTATGGFTAYRFAEPSPSQLFDGNPNSILDVVCDRFNFSWGGVTEPKLDCEAMLCAPNTASQPGRLYFINKFGAESNNKTWIWRAPLNLSAYSADNTLSKVADITSTTPKALTAGDWRADNAEITVTTQHGGDTYAYVPGGPYPVIGRSWVYQPETWAYLGERDIAVANRRPDLSGVPGMESLCYTPDSLYLICGSEGGGSEVWRNDYGVVTPIPDPTIEISAIDGSNLSVTVSGGGPTVTRYSLWAKKGSTPNATEGSADQKVAIATYTQAGKTYTWNTGVYADGDQFYVRARVYTDSTATVGSQIATKSYVASVIEQPRNKKWKYRKNNQWVEVVPETAPTPPNDPNATNVLVNPSFEVDASNWEIEPVQSTLTKSTTGSAKYGTYYGLLTSNSGGSFTPFTAAVISDPHYGDPNATSPTWTASDAAMLNRLNAINPNYVIECGDVGDTALAVQYTTYQANMNAWKSKTLAVPGNHDEQASQNITNWWSYFGSGTHVQGTASAPWWSTDINGWHFIGLSIWPSDGWGYLSGSTQYNWLAADLAANAGKPTVAIWHASLFAFDVTHVDLDGRTGAANDARDIWALLHSYNVNVIINGHAHIQSRTQPVNSSGVPTANAPIQFQVSPVRYRGVRDPSSSNTTPAWTQTLTANHRSILKFTFNQNSFNWEYQLVSSGSVIDSGSASTNYSASSGGAETTFARSTPEHPAAPGSVWSAGAYFRWGTGTARVCRVDISFLDSNKGRLSGSSLGTPITPGTGVYTQSIVEGAVAPANAAYVQARIAMVSASGSDTVHVDGVQLEPSATLPAYNPLPIDQNTMKPIWGDIVPQTYAVNTHYNFAGTVNANWDAIDALLGQGGFRTHRGLATTTSAIYDHWRTIYNTYKVQTHVTICPMSSLYTQSAAPYTTPISNSAMDTLFDARLDRIVSYGGASVFASIGLPNEPNDGGNTPDYANWDTVIANAASRLAARMAVKGLSAIPMVAPALKMDETTLSTDYAKLAPIDSYITYGDHHIYPATQSHWDEEYSGHTTQPEWMPVTNMWDQRFIWGQQAWGTKPFYITELGWNDYPPDLGTYGQTPDSIAGTYQPVALLEAVKRGVKKLFIYELMDDDPKSGVQDWWGIVDAPSGSNSTPSLWVKEPAYVNTKKLVDLCTDQGATYDPPAVPLVLANNTGVRHLLIGKRDGSVILFMWQDYAIYNVITEATRTPSSINVTVTNAATSRVVPVGAVIVPVQIVNPGGSPSSNLNIISFP